MIKRSPRLMTIGMPPHTSFLASKQSFQKLDLNWHYHPEIELMLILNGRGWMHIGHSVHRFTAGGLFVLGSNLPHSWISRGPLEVIVVVFRPDLFQDLFAARYELAAVKTLLENAERGLQIEGRTRRDAGERISRLLLRADNASVRFLRFLEILVRIGCDSPKKYLSPDRHFRSFKPTARRRMLRVTSFIEQTACTSITHGNAAALAGMTPTAFSRFFRRNMGRTFEAYVNDVRIGQVCAKLRESGQSITEIAFECGFLSLANFNRRFRERLGTTPRRYRSRAS